MGQVFTVIKTLVTFAGYFKQVYGLLAAIRGAVLASRDKKNHQKVEEAAEKLDKAQTEQEKKDAIRDIAVGSF